jgi:hypothetical protein
LIVLRQGSKLKKKERREENSEINIWQCTALILKLKKSISIARTRTVTAFIYSFQSERLLQICLVFSKVRKTRAFIAFVISTVSIIESQT